MRVLILSQWFSPEPDFKGLPFAGALGELGHDVEVLTGFPNYPGGRIYPGYHRQAWARESIAGVPVCRVWLYPSHDRSAVRRVLNYLSFAVSASVFGLFLVKKPDVIYAYHAPATIGLPALILSWVWRVPFVYDINDLWPDTLRATGMVQGRLVLWLVGKWCQLVYSFASRITVVTPGFRTALLERAVPPEKVELIYNWGDERALFGLNPERDDVAPRHDGSFTVLYPGTLGMAQRLDSVLSAAELCLSRVPRAQFVFVGDGPEAERLRLRVSSAGLSNVVFLPRVSVEAAGEMIRKADVMLVHLRDDELFRITIPSKTQMAMALGCPIVMAVRGDAAALTETAGAGLVCEPENPESIADAVEKLAAMPRSELLAMGQSGKDYYHRYLSLRAGGTAFERVMRDAVSTRTGTRIGGTHTG